MASAHLQKYRSEFSAKLHEDNAVTRVLAKIEDKTGVDRLYIVGGVAAIFALFLIFADAAELVCNLIGFVFPAYVSVKAIESKNKDDDTQWLTYWVVFAALSIVEFASETICGYFPIYYLVKCVFLIWLQLPMTRGAEKIYARAIQPLMQRFPNFSGDHAKAH